MELRCDLVITGDHQIWLRRGDRRAQGRKRMERRVGIGDFYEGHLSHRVAPGQSASTENPAS